MIIRNETSADIDPIYQLTKAAFEGRPYAAGDEQDVVNRLRTKDALTLSLVLEIEARVVGHIAFSPAMNSDDSGPWMALGPVSILPIHQRQGLGSELITEGLRIIEGEGAVGCILTGNPEYYSRFGFEPAPEYSPVSEPSEYFQIKRFSSLVPQGHFSFDPAFYGE